MQLGFIFLIQVISTNITGQNLTISKYSPFDGKVIDNSGYMGDVKYHLGYSTDKETPNGTCHVSLAFNPSHLEFVNPVACGIARAKQRRRTDTVERKKVVPICIHGDAAFADYSVNVGMAYRFGGQKHMMMEAPAK